MLKPELLSYLAAYISISYCLDGLPDYIHVCPQNIDATQCITDNVERLRPYLTNGIPELEVPSIEPLHVGDLLLSEKTNDNGITINVKNLKTFGPSAYKVTKLNIARWGEEYHFDIHIPHVYVEGVYNVDGRILLLQLKGAGEFAGNFTTASGSVKCFLKKHSSDDEIVQVHKLEIKIKLGDGSIKLKDLFRGDRVLADAINNVINANFELFNKEFVPLVEKALQKTFKKVGNKIISRYTYAQLFPA